MEQRPVIPRFGRCGLSDVHRIGTLPPHAARLRDGPARQPLAWHSSRRAIGEGHPGNVEPGRDSLEPRLEMQAGRAEQVLDVQPVGISFEAQGKGGQGVRDTERRASVDQDIVIRQLQTDPPRHR